MRFETIEDVRLYLEQIPKFQNVGHRAAKMGLDSIRSACAELGNPQQGFASVHVAGTNGKGTVCHCLSAIYQDAGYRVGLYTSPHLLDFKERIKINGLEIPDESLVYFFQEYFSIINRYKLTYFEILTTLAFWWFKKQRVDIAIIETGLGGLLDATNIVTPLISVITSISKDHQEYLGTTITEIAIQKAGIIKRQIPVVVGALPSDALKVIRNKALLENVIILEGDLLHPYLKNGYIFLKDELGELKLKTDLIGSVQAINLAICWQVVRHLKPKILVTRESFIKTVQTIRVKSALIARFEPLLKGQKWFFDGAHNTEAVKNLKNTLQQYFEKEESIIVLSLMRDKINEKLMKEFSEFKKIFYYTINSERAAGYEEVSSYLNNLQRLSNNSDSVRSFLRQCNTKLVIFTGSFYFYKTVKDWINEFSLT